MMFCVECGGPLDSEYYQELADLVDTYGWAALSGEDQIQFLHGVCGNCDEVKNCCCPFCGDTVQNGDCVACSYTKK